MTRAFLNSSVVKKFATPGFFFPAANVANFMQGHNAVATCIALFNFAYCSILIGGSSYLERAPNQSSAKQLFIAISIRLNDTSPTDRLIE
jgi:hypothetical protein